MGRRGAAIALGAVAASVAAAGVVAVALRRDPVRATRLRRTATLARAGARTGTSYVSMRARSALADEERRRELADEYQLRSAEQVAEMLGGMKGALMKLGQMASYLDQGLPEPVREALAQLQQDAPPMAPELVDEVVAAELGRLPAEAFAEWDPVPLAAASIG